MDDRAAQSQVSHCNNDSDTPATMLAIDLLDMLIVGEEVWSSRLNSKNDEY